MQVYNCKYAKGKSWNSVCHVHIIQLEYKMTRGVAFPVAVYGHD